ncbi:MAG: hypothetical protein NVS3B8_18030 [Chitinophagaceae bacterium]
MQLPKFHGTAAGIRIVEHFKKKEDIMNNIMKRENSRQPATFGSVVDQIFQNNLNRFFEDDFWGGNNNLYPSRVPVNIRETDKSYELELIAPGLRKQDFQLQIADNILTVSFKHTEENSGENKEGGWLKQEYKKQEFSRHFSLDDTVDAGKISARYEDGILKLQLLKKENAQKVSRTIEIH